MEQNRLREVSPKTMEFVRAHMLDKHFGRGVVITDEALLRDYVMAIIDGMARGYYIHRDHERTYAFAFEGDLLGVPRSLMRIKDVTVGIEFLENSRVLLIPKREVGSFLENADDASYKEVMSAIITELVDRLQNVEEQMIMYQSMSARERYEWFVGRYPKVLERATIMQIASFLGVTKETLYRIRAGRYQAESVIKTDKDEQE